MSRGLVVALSPLLALGLLALGSRPQTFAQTSAPPAQSPAIAAPVPVTLDPSTTAFLALDFQSTNCTDSVRPACVASLPTLGGAIAAARAANVPIVYSYTSGGTIRSEIAPAANDVQLETFGADKFNRTNLDDMLKGMGATTLIVTGTASNGAALYTSYEAAARGYTVVIPVDLISASNPFADFYTEWQLLNAPGTNNPQNMPLLAKMVTLSRSDMISYGGAPAFGGPAPSPSALQVPSIPDPVAVTLDSTSTAFLALDFTPTTCALPDRPICVATLTAVQYGIAAARAGKVPVIYTAFANGSLVPEIQPQDGEPVLISRGADKFLLSDLGDALNQSKPTTLVIVGTFTNGAVIYTAFQAAARGYTVVIAQDGLSAPSDFATVATEWQLMNGPGTVNAQNTPLTPKAVTLSRTDLITYK